LLITFLTDFGLEDDFVGTCNGVMKRIAPDVEIIDVTHGISPQSVLQGALVLANTVPYLPECVHLAVVDPGVGSERRAVALRADQRTFVGPDNGLLIPAAERSGPIDAAHEITNREYALEPVSATFHGRDIFAPVAARLAAGEPLAEGGEPLEPGDLVSVELPTPAHDGDTVIAHALTVDRFGNATLDVSHQDLQGSGLRLGRPLGLQVGAQHFTAWYAVTFADVRPGEILVYEDAYRMLSVAVNRGSAAEVMGLSPDRELRIWPA
jgi:S-adenosyl-L-methionine hydrolase (adenosine-forming)